MPTTSRLQTRRLTAGLALALVAALALAGCAGVPLQLAGQEFVSVSVTDGGVPHQLVDDTKIRLTFTPADVSGNAGCNHFGGTYRIEDGTLLFEGGGMTDMGCDPELHAQDAFVTEFLASRPAISLVGTDLRLQSGAVVITLRDREVVEPDAQLVGPTWTVESIIMGDAVASVPAEPVATLVFKADGTIEVNAGCNRGSGTWTAVGAGIEVSPLMLTKMACEKDGAELESAVLGVLEAGRITAQIDSTLLTLQAGDRGLQLRAS